MFDRPILAWKAKDLLAATKNRPATYWQARGEEAAVRLFHDMARRVPAYRDFLARAGLRPERVRTIADFHDVPLVDKESYLLAYPLADLCWDGELSQRSMVYSTTSGSTGNPYYFPRTEEQDRQYAQLAEMYLLENFQIDRYSTLYINGFAMGAWIGGLFTYQAVRHVAENGRYRLSIISPGINKLEIIRAIETIGGHYDQVILGGYPPFLKSLIDDGEAAGLRWKQYNIKCVFSAEAFSESFRQYVCRKVGIRDTHVGTLNHYGTVDLGTMAHETPQSIIARQAVAKKGTVLFPERHKMPTLAQYIPEHFYFEEHDHGLICSARAGLPLVRYDLKDYGGVHTEQSLLRAMGEQDLDLPGLLRERDASHYYNHLPYVYVYERKNFTVKLYGAIIYPETIKKVLHRAEYLSVLSGKFKLSIEVDDRQDQRLDIHCELQRHGQDPLTPGLQASMQRAIMTALRKENSEYTVLYREMPQRLAPNIIFWPYESPTHFSPNGKQRWVA